MSIRAKVASETRCSRCFLRHDDCLCALLPTITPRLNLVIVRHTQERHKPTSTTRLVMNCVTGTVVHDWVGRGVPIDLALDPADSFLLFPRQDGPAIPAAELADWPRPPTVVIVDGTWRQCRKMAHNVPGLRGLRTVQLPSSPASRPAMRTQIREDGLATAEAVSRLLTAAGDDGAPLFHVYRLMVERVLKSRGTWVRELKALQDVTSS